MRVIAGKFRSRNLQSVEGLDTRPTYDRLKETLFNVLAAAGRLEGSVFVDLFAGTGSIGIEALSRGASKVYFAESEKKPVRVIRANLQSLAIGDEAEVYECSAVDAIRRLSELGVKADILFMDPPYKLQGAYAQVMRVLNETELLSGGGILVAEHDKRFDPGDGEGRFARSRRLQQGESALSFYRVNAKQDGA